VCVQRARVDNTCLAVQTDLDATQAYLRTVLFNATDVDSGFRGIEFVVVDEFSLSSNVVFRNVTLAPTPSTTILNLDPAQLTYLAAERNYVVITFSEAMVKEAGFIVVQCLSNNTQLASIDVTSSL